MSKLMWYCIQIIWSAAYLFFLVYQTLLHADFTFGGGDNSEAGMILTGGAAIYLLLSAGYIFAGEKFLYRKDEMYIWQAIAIALLTPPAMLLASWIYAQF